jgi:hypothetical protein
MFAFLKDSDYYSLSLLSPFLKFVIVVDLDFMSPSLEDQFSLPATDLSIRSCQQGQTKTQPIGSAICLIRWTVAWLTNLDGRACQKFRVKHDYRKGMDGS